MSFFIAAHFCTFISCLNPLSIIALETINQDHVNKIILPGIGMTRVDTRYDVGKGCFLSQWFCLHPCQHHFEYFQILLPKLCS